MESLTKENFWNDLNEKYPKGMKVFCEWVDEYKKKNDWEKLFNYGSPHYAKQGWHNPKFHDLPYAIQIGIWIQFCVDGGGCQWEIEDLFTHDWLTDITEHIKLMQVDEDILDA